MRDRGFGFIKAEAGPDVFFHRSHVLDEFDTLQEGDPVVYELQSISDKGPMTAWVKRPTATDEQAEAPPQQVVALGLFGNDIRLVGLAPDGTFHFLDPSDNLHTVLYVASSETLAVESAIAELEDLVNSSSAAESDFQDFFERHPDFLLNSDYVAAHPHVVLTAEGQETMVPDFVLEPLDRSALCDLLELKLPSAPVFVLKKRRIRFSWAVHEACAQLREYQAFFEEEKNRLAVQQKYDLLAYRPKMFVVLGRRGRVDPIVSRRIQSDLPVCVRTYDEVVERARHRAEQMRRGGHSAAHNAERGNGR